MRILFTPFARAQFLSTLAFIRQDKPDAAVRFRRRAETALKRLSKFPDSGRPIPEFPDLPHREVIIGSYRFFYRVRGKIVWVVAVWHGAQIPGVPGKTEDS